MDSTSPTIALENGLDLSKLFTTGSVLHINQEYEDHECHVELDKNCDIKTKYIGEPVKCFEEFVKDLKSIDEHGFVKKKILEEGGGLPLNKNCSVSVAFTGYWENENVPFDCSRPDKPWVANLNDNGFLPGIQMAIESMLVGEISVFLLSYEVMYGELGVPPRIKPKADCIFYIQLIKCTITPADGDINFAEPNMFQRIHQEVKMLYSAGLTLHKTKNYAAAIQLFRKGVNMLHRCRLADESEESIQEKLLVKLYINLSICYNEVKQPLKTCIACNELNRLGSLWNNAKVLFQNAKAFRMIGKFNAAEKRLRRAMQLSPENEKLLAEMELIEKLKTSCNQSRLVENKMLDSIPNLGMNEDFKVEVDNLIKNFKGSVDICKLTLPGNLNMAEMEYIKEACVRENLFCNKIQEDYLLDKEEEKVPIDLKVDLFV